MRTIYCNCKKIIVSENTSGGKNYAIVEDDEVKVILNEETKRIGCMPISEAKEFAHSIIDALSMREKLRMAKKKHIDLMVNSRTMKEETYSLTDVDELMEYMWLKPDRTGLKVDIFVDDCGSYERYGHPLLLWARNGYGREVSEFIPFLVSDQPTILNLGIDCRISEEDVVAIQGFIQRNLEILIELPADLISQIDFVESVKKHCVADEGEADQRQALSV